MYEFQGKYNDFNNCKSQNINQNIKIKDIKNIHDLKVGDLITYFHIPSKRKLYSTIISKKNDRYMLLVENLLYLNHQYTLYMLYDGYHEYMKDVKLVEYIES